MIGITYTLVGVERAIRRYREDARKQYQAGAIAWLESSVLKIHGEALKGIQRVSMGRVYTHFLARNTRTGNLFPSRKRNKPHVASKPGEPFNVDTGATWKTIRWKVDKQKLTARVFSSSNVAMWMEFGTSTVAARPWLMPAYRAVRKDLKPQGKLLKGVE